jgi:hypothetical protein
MGMELSLGDLVRPKHLWEFSIEDFLVVARPDFSGLYILSPSARLIWEIQKSGAPFETLVREFAAAYDIPKDIAEQDVKDTLDAWASGLLSEQRSSPTANLASELGSSSSSRPDVFARDYLIQGKNVRLILQTSGLTEEIAPRLESLPPAPSAPDFTFRVVEDRDGFRIFCDGCCVGTEDDIAVTRTLLLQEIVRSCRGRDLLAVFHAGACGSDSRCAVFPATTQSGKTTLAAVLMKTGLTLYSDDSVLLERDTFSVPVMPFALMIREGSWNLLYPRFPELRAAPIVDRFGQRIRFLPPLGTKRDGQCGQVAAIVFSRFKTDAATELTAIDPLQTLLRLQESGFWVAHDERSIRAFLAWIQATPSFTLSYSDVDQAASIVRRLIG